VRGGSGKLRYSAITTVDCVAAGRVIFEEEGNDSLIPSSTLWVVVWFVVA